jgi:hypothetical protein
MRTAAAIALALVLSPTCTRLAVADEKGAAPSSTSLQGSVNQDDELHFETVLTVHGEIASVDPASRRLTLKRQGAGTLALEARDQKTLEGVKAGDRVVIRYVEGVHIRDKKPGEGLPMASLKAGVPRRHLTVASVGAMDETFQEVALKDPDGSQETVMVENPETLEHLKVGDQVVITRSWALALSLDKEN